MSKLHQEDPWAGFVDVLSNILMVVIFLVVILGISIFAISQQITKAAVEKAIQAEKTKSEAQAHLAQAGASDTVRETAPIQTVAQTAPPSAEPNKVDGKTGTAGVFDAALGQRVRQADDIEGNTNLSVRSTKVAAARTIEVAAEETAPSSGPVQVQTSQAFLTLKFARGAFKIDQAASAEMRTFISSQSEMTGSKIEIRAFAQSTVGSISEARRIAYYRAMQTRSELIKTGVAAVNVEVKVRESMAPEESDVVRIFAKP